MQPFCINASYQFSIYSILLMFKKTFNVQFGIIYVQAPSHICKPPQHDRLHEVQNVTT